MTRIRPQNLRCAPAAGRFFRLALLPLAVAFALPVVAEDSSLPELSWYTRDQLSAAEQENLPEFCNGIYRTPDITLVEGGQIEAEADQSVMQKNGDSLLTGDVLVRQSDQQLRADEAQWYQSRAYGEFRGNVSLSTPDLVMAGDDATLDQAKGRVRFNGARYAMPARHLRGTAEQIDTREDGRLSLNDATFTFCEPGHNDWDVAASELYLDQNTGVGEAWHTRLRVAEVPVLYVPYYRFPIGDQRMTGFLDPSFTFNGQGQAEDIQIPFYWNIAPNADATLIAHHILDRGMLWESQFRHKTSALGEGELNYGYLNEDETDGGERWGMNLIQDGTFGSGWEHHWIYNHVSDSDYLSDMQPAGAIVRTTHLPRRGTVLWNDSDWHFDVIAESFQTIDDTITLANRPYRRLPQMNLSYAPNVINAWQFGQTLQTTRFNRDDQAVINDTAQTLTGFAALNGDRLVSDTAIAYPMEWPFAFLTPKVEYRYRAYQLSDADAALSDDVELDVSHGSGRYSLDSGLYFDREFNWFGQEYQQTLEPRLYWVQSPYVKDQDLIPNFDSTRTTVTYSNLFTGDRFTGGDRLADLDQISTGLTTRFINGDGLEQFRASVGRIWYNADRRVQLTGTTLPDADEQAVSSTLGEVEWNPTEQWSLYHTLEWDSYEAFARQRRYGARFESSENRFLNLSTNTVQTWDTDEERVDTTTRQLDAGFFWSLTDRWAVVGRQLRDLRSYGSDEKRPESPVLESLAGFEYQNCCWRVQMMYRETSPTSDGTEFTTEKRYGFMLSIQLKGLTTFGSGTDDIISEGISGYSRRTYHDY